ncbi:MAG: hypothetical protein NC218_10770 [Acetobacter sp.]|nr:hypothetical protein [Acetobacter sp.]
MLSKILYTFPELSLLLGIAHLYLRYVFGEDSPKLFARIARYWLLISIFCLIIFYNQSINLQYFNNDAYTFLFRFVIGISAYILLCVSPQYFSAEKKTGCKFNCLILLALCVLNIMLSAINITVLTFAYCLLTYITYRLQESAGEELPTSIKMRYLSAAAVILLLLTIGFSGLYNLTGGRMEYQFLANILKKEQGSFSTYMFVSCLLIPFLYSLGIAPFHSFAEDKNGRAILPVSHYLSIIAPWAYWGVIIKLNITLVSSYSADITPVYIFFALLSVIFGAMGTNARINLHRIYSFSATYYFGVMLLLLSLFTPTSCFAAYTCLLTYMLGLNGVYLVFYSIKSRNEYLSALTSLSGLAETRPLATATLLISLFSLIGVPPLAGFLGQASAVTELIAAQKFISLGIVFFCLLLLAKSYLEIIKTAYFEHKIINYDVENKITRFLMLISIICMISIAFNPFNIIDKLKDMFYVVFI